MGIDLKEQEYWNDVERQTKDGDYLLDNFDKRRVLIHELSKIDFTGAKVLEIGTGNGLTAHLVRSMTVPFDYQGLDVSDKFAATAQRLFRLPVKVGDAADLPWEDGAFDSVWAFDSFEHIAPNKRERMYQEIDRVLKKDRRCIIINNPLDEHTSGHDKDFDFGFSEVDLGRLCEVTKTRIYYLKTLESKIRQYQFIVLGSLV